MILFVTGPSCSGKSSLVNDLVDDPTIVVEDIDSIGTPRAAPLEWLRWRGAELLFEWATHKDPPEHVVICGISWPHQIIDSNAWPVAQDAGLPVGFMMLDVTPKLMRQRLRERLSDRTKAEVSEYVRYNLELADKLRSQVRQQRRGVVVDVTKRTPTEVANLVRLSLEWLPSLNL